MTRIAKHTVANIGLPRDDNSDRATEQYKILCSAWLWKKTVAAYASSGFQ